MVKINLNKNYWVINIYDYKTSFKGLIDLLKLGVDEPRIFEAIQNFINDNISQKVYFLFQIVENFKLFIRIFKKNRKQIKKLVSKLVHSSITY